MSALILFSLVISLAAVDNDDEEEDNYSWLWPHPLSKKYTGNFVTSSGFLIFFLQKNTLH